MKVIKNPKRTDWDLLIQRPLFNQKELENSVSEIMNDVRQGGNQAVLDYVRKFQKYTGGELLISKNEIENAGDMISKELKTAIIKAKLNIEVFHKAQKHEELRIETAPGVICRQVYRPVESVGLYVPGGTAPLFSTVLMLAVPAQIAGCRNIVLCTPCDSEGKIDPAILFAAKLCGVSCILKAGGAQGIAAMAYGTESVPKTYKIFGPGNQYVTMAKSLAFATGTAIDMPAGPSEVMVVADNSAVPSFVAADLLSQAEHGEDSQVFLVSTSESMVEKTMLEIDNQLEDLPRKTIAEKALQNSSAILFDDITDVQDFMNYYAPEHLILSVENYENWVEKIQSAGSVFLGNLTPESAGDYASGTNHTLPTNGFAKAFSGLSLSDYQKKITLQEISKEGLMEIGKTIEIMAEAEGLQAHKNAVSIRLKSI